MTVTYEAIATYTTTNQATISFTSIPQTYTDLVIMFHTKTVNNAAALVANFNSDAGANYNWYWMYGSETVKGTVKTGNDTKLRWGRGQTNSGQSASNELNIFNYSSTSVGKAILARENNFDVVFFGLHAARPAPKSKAPPPCLTKSSPNYNRPLFTR